MEKKVLLMATMNPHKLEEVKDIIEKHGVAEKFSLQSLADIGFTDGIPETAPTLEGNASMKSHFANRLTNLNCFSDDTGLEVDALEGGPGVFSARYAGDDANSLNNIRKLLTEMEGVTNRRARFRTVISLIFEGVEYYFEGVVEGEILIEPEGTNGFGYDPIFKPSGSKKSFGNMTNCEKNNISHRFKAIQEMAKFLSAL